MTIIGLIVRGGVVTVVMGCEYRSDCNNQGNCMNGECYCDWGYRGKRCQTAWCVNGDKTKTGECECLYPRLLTRGVCQLTCGGHGNTSGITGQCRCDPEWFTASVVDTVAYLEGACRQYRCQSDLVCQTSLGLSGARCHPSNTNCYCGLGHFGYDHNKARCMSSWYAFSEWVGLGVISVMNNLWQWTLVVASLVLPFGQVRTRCPHRRDWLVKLGIRRCTCEGECTLRYPWNGVGCQEYWDDIQDDFAWSIWVITLGAWVYLWLVLLKVALLILWSVVFWTALVVAGGVRYCRRRGVTLPSECREGKILALHWMPPRYWSKWLLPRCPDNRGGGGLGYLVGTHPNQLTYHSTNGCWNRLLGLTACHDYRHVSQVMGSIRDSLRETVPLPDSGFGAGERVCNGVSVWTDTDRRFSRGELASGSYDDYLTNQCPICEEAPEGSCWARLGCGHAVCASCALRMVSYRHPQTGLAVGFPCFACRGVSRTIIIRSGYCVFGTPVRSDTSVVL